MTLRIRFAIQQLKKEKDKKGAIKLSGESVLITFNDNVTNNVEVQEESTNKIFKRLENSEGFETETDDTNKLVIIADDKKSARKIYALLHLKNKVKNKDDLWDFVIEKIDYDRSFLTGNTLILRTRSFENNLDNIDISDIELENKKINVIHSDFKENRKELFELEDLLSDLETRFKSPDASISDAASKLNKLLNYSSGDSIKKDLYDLRESPGIITGWVKNERLPHIFRLRIDSLVNFLTELAVWSTPEIGLTTVEQVLKANANGFIIAQRGGSRLKVTVGQKYDASSNLTLEVGDGYLTPGSDNVNAIINTLRGGKYRGLPIFDPDQSAPVAAASGFFSGREKAKVLFDFQCQPSSKYTKDKIDNFCNFLKKMGKESGDIDKRKCFGFEIKDIEDVRYQGRIGGKPKQDKTKIIYDIWMAPDLEAAINLAFFGSPYPEMHNVDNDLLFLNEIEGKTRKEMLDIYLNHGLRDEMCGSGEVFDFGNDWHDNNYYNNDESKKIVDRAHEVIKKWLDILDDYEKDNKYTGRDKNKLKEVKKELEKLKSDAAADTNSYEKKLVDKWESKINELITVINAALGDEEQPNPDPDGPPRGPDAPPLPNNNLPTDIINKIEELLKNESNAYAQKIYQQVKKMTAADGITLKIVEKLKELIDLVKFAYEGTFSSDNLRKLENFSSAVAGSEEGKAWAIAKKVPGETGKSWVEEGLIKLQKSALTEAQNKLKDAVGDEEIYQKIVKDIENDISDIEHATNIFLWAKEALAIEGADETPEVKDLKSKLQTAQNYTKAWNAVDNYKPDSGNADGYATKAWKKIQSFSKKRQEFVDKSRLAEAKSRAELDQFYQKMKESENFTGSLKESVEKKSYPRAQIVASIIEKGDKAKAEEKALIELIKPFINQAEIDTDFGNNLDRSVFQDLKTKKEGLAKYTTSGTAENAIFKDLPAEQQTTISSLYSELAAKVSKMEKAIQNQDDERRKKPELKNQQKPFYKTTFGKIFLGSIVIVILGVVIWFLWRKLKAKQVKNKKSW